MRPIGGELVTTITSPSCLGTHFLYLSNPPSGNLLPIIPWHGAPALSRAASTRHHPYLYLFIIPVKTCRTSSLSPPLFILNINTPSPWLSCPPQLRGEAAFREGNAVDRSDQVMVDIMGTVTHGYIPNNGPILYPLHKNVWSTHPLDKTGGVIHAARG